MSNFHDSLGNIAAMYGGYAQRESNGFERLVDICLVILFIFIMAAVIAWQSLRQEITVKSEKIKTLTDRCEAAETERDYHSNRWVHATSTELQDAVAGQEKAIITLQQQQILLKLLEIEKREHQQRGFNAFVTTNHTGEMLFDVSHVFDGQKIVDPLFAQSCRLAKTSVPRRAELRDEWRKEILETLKLSLPKGEKVFAINTPKVLTADNAKWLDTEIENRVRNVCLLSVRLQRSAFAHVVKGYETNPASLDNPNIRALLARYRTASPAHRPALAAQMHREIYEHTRNVFEEQEIPILKNLL